MTESAAAQRDPFAAPDGASPMMAQYLEIKAAHPGYLLFYRMGDFYEMFFDDAGKAAAALDIALTKRGKHRGEDIPMCGVPVHAADAYLPRLIKAGLKVAICEQIEDPAEARKRGAKAVVRRAVTRLVTAGTLSEDSLLDARANNYLAALAEAEGALALAWLDVSTGEFAAALIDAGRFEAALARLQPGEILISERLAATLAARLPNESFRERLTLRAATDFDSVRGARRLREVFGVATLDGFGAFSRAELAAAGALLFYLDETQKGERPSLRPLTRAPQSEVMAIDAATRRGLELTRTLGGERKGSLLAAIDLTVTALGARLLARRLAAPLTDPAAINARLDMVAYFAEADALRGRLRERLRRAPDIERALARLSLKRGGPRDLAAIRDGLGEAAAIRALLAETRAEPLGPAPDGIVRAAAALDGHAALASRLQSALIAEPPLFARDGGFIAAGCSAALDEQRALHGESRRLIAALEARYRAETGIASLKARHNGVLGFFLEVTPAHADKLMAAPLNAAFIHRQTLANAVRFSTVELADLADRTGRAEGQALEIELRLFESLCEETLSHRAALLACADALAALDVASALAELARERGFVRPEVDGSTAFAIEGGRHPVVELALEAARAGPFTPNDCDLGPDRRLWLLTGPNMAGKSTFLRQNALIAILAQMGSFAPARRAHIGVIDKLFSRIGAADDLARGRSTFMVEMIEAAAILNQAGEKSLVILDELGRGTATFDGLSIAFAAIEHLHETNACRTLFATHYHELTALAARLPRLAPHAMRVKEWRGEVVFLHEVAPGAADRSYGIQVARLAGLPTLVVTRAEQILRSLETGEQGGAVARLADDLPLFSAALKQPEAAPKRNAAAAALALLKPDEMSPREALDALYRLKALLSEEDDE